MKQLKAILFFCLSAGITLIFVELFIRFTSISELSMTVFDSKLGKVKKANTDYVKFNEGFSLGKINSLGYLGSEYPKEKLEKTFRIVLLGDSYVEGFQVFERNHFGKILEQKLQTNYKNQKIEVLNFGRSGFDIGDMYVYKKLFVNQFSPDLVFYFISEEDLEVRNSQKLLPNIDIENEELVIKHQFDKEYTEFYNSFGQLTQNFVFANMLKQTAETIRDGNPKKIIFDKFYNLFYNIKPSLKPSNSNYELNPITKKIITQLEENEFIINRESKALPSEFIDLIKLENISFVDLSLPLKNLQNKGIKPNYWKVTNKYGHWNHYAHQTIGNYLSKLKVFDSLLVE